MAPQLAETKSASSKHPRASAGAGPCAPTRHGAPTLALRAPHRSTAFSTARNTSSARTPRPRRGTEDESVAERRDHQRAHVVDVGRRLSAQRRARLGGEDQRLAAARTRAEAHVIAHLAHARCSERARRAGRARPRGSRLRR